MKLFKILLCVLSILIFGISCTKDSGLQITKPGPELILSKMQNGNWNGAKAEGNTLTITGGSGNLNGNYTFDSPVLGLGGVYKDPEKEDYILAAPSGDGLVVVEMDQTGKEAIDAILGVVGESGGEKVMGNLIQQIANSGGNIDLSDPDKILAGTDLPDDKRKEIEAILENSSGGFKNSETIS